MPAPCSRNDGNHSTRCRTTSRIFQSETGEGASQSVTARTLVVKPAAISRWRSAGSVGRAIGLAPSQACSTDWLNIPQKRCGTNVCSCIGGRTYGSSFITGSSTTSGATSTYSNWLSRWLMQLSRAAFLSSDGTTYHGACLMSV